MIAICALGMRQLFWAGLSPFRNQFVTDRCAEFVDTELLPLVEKEFKVKLTKALSRKKEVKSFVLASDITRCHTPPNVRLAIRYQSF
jgi:hypothetical protein